MLILGIYLMLQVIKQYAGVIVSVDGSSMSPTYKDSTILVLQPLPATKLCYRGDVVVFNDGQGDVIKRVIGIPGDRIHLVMGQLLINGRTIEEPYIPKSCTTYPQDYGDDIVADANQYIMMGDNRENSCDSRTYGPILVSKIYGVIPAKLKPKLGKQSATLANMHTWRKSKTKQ